MVFNFEIWKYSHFFWVKIDHFRILLVNCGDFITRLKLLFYLSIFGTTLRRFPDLWPVIISTISCIVFVIYFISGVAMMYINPEKKPEKLDSIQRQVLAARAKKRNWFSKLIFWSVKTWMHWHEVFIMSTTVHMTRMC